MARKSDAEYVFGDPNKRSPGSRTGANGGTGVIYNNGIAVGTAPGSPPLPQPPGSVQTIPPSGVQRTSNWGAPVPDFSGGYSGPNAYQPDPRLTGLIDWMSAQRRGDIKGGEDFAGKYFGANNPEMKAILEARKGAAFGTDGQTQLAREAGTEGINRSVQTALRQFSGRLPSTGVRGGAAGAMAGLLTRDAVGQTRGLERDLAINEMNRRREALGSYESSLTGERAGLLGTTFAHAGMGSQDRYGGMQYIMGQDFLDQARQNAANNTGPGSGPGAPWYQKYLNPGTYLDPKTYQPGNMNNPMTWNWTPPGTERAGDVVKKYIPGIG